MSVKAVTMKKINVFLKNNNGLDEVLEMLECTEDELVQQLSLRLGRNQKKVDHVIAELKRNDKKPKKAKRFKIDETEVETIIKPKKAAESKSSKKPAVIIDETNDISKEAAKSKTDNSKATTESEPKKSRFQELTELESKLRDECIKLEEERNQYLSECHKIRHHKLKPLEKALEDLLREYTAKREELISQSNLCNEYGGIANELHEKKKVVKTQLEQVRAELETLKTVNLFVYEDGTIEAPESPDFKLDKTGAEAKWQELVGKEEYSELRVKDVRILAELISITYNSERKIMVTCDNMELQKAYDLLKETL